MVTILALWATLSLVQATRQLVQNHTLQGQGLFDETPSAARLHFAQAVKTAGSFGLRRIGLSIDNRLARLWLGQYRKTSPPVIHWHDAAVTAAALSADGQRLATGTLNGTIMVWNTPTGQQIGEPIHHGAHIECVVFSPDATLVASAGRDNRARVWWVPSGEPVGEPIAHEDYVMWADFDPTGSRLATVGADGSVRITELGNWTQIDLKPGHGSSNHRVEFSPDGKRISRHPQTARPDCGTLGRGLLLTSRWSKGTATSSLSAETAASY